MEEFNIWDLERVNIKLKPNFIKKINSKIISNFKNKRMFYDLIYPEKEIDFFVFKNLLKQSYNNKFFVPLSIYLRIIEKLNIAKEELQEDIIAYKVSGGINYIESPKLPIKITPIFDMIYAHNIGDGFVMKCGKNRLPYFGYRQFNKFYRESYLKKCAEIFGNAFFYKKTESSTRVCCPAVTSTLFFKYYNVVTEAFLSDKARISLKVFENGKESMLAVLIAFIIDEGNIDSTQITINLKNPGLIKDLDKICSVLEYKTKATKSNLERYQGYSRLHILREGMKKLWGDYLTLNKKYPVIDLGWKGEKIRNSFKIFNRKVYKTVGNRELILEILKNEQLSVNQIAERINMTRQGVRFHIHNLLKEGKIKLINSNELNWIYGV